MTGSLITVETERRSCMAMVGRCTASTLSPASVPKTLLVPPFTALGVVKEQSTSARDTWLASDSHPLPVDFHLLFPSSLSSSPRRPPLLLPSFSPTSSSTSTR